MGTTVVYNMTKYGTNTGVNLTYINNEIIFYSSLPYLKKKIKSSDDEFLWKVLTYLYEPHTLSEIQTKFNLPQNLALDIIHHLLQSQLIIENPTERTDDFFRLDRFVNSPPQLNYADYKKSARPPK